MKKPIHSAVLVLLSLCALHLLQLHLLHTTIVTLSFNLSASLLISPEITVFLTPSYLEDSPLFRLSMCRDLGASLIDRPLVLKYSSFVSSISSLELMNSSLSF
jgi:hypothetical protein